jgi:hypothetical protein
MVNATTARGLARGEVLCSGCHALVPDVDGATHPYIGASPGCWAIFGEVLAKEYGEYHYPAVHRLTVDTYAAQHPGTPARRSIQSVAIHLISLHLLLERDFTSPQATEAIREALQRQARFVWLEPPPTMGSITVLDVRGASDVAEHQRLVWQWARSVWAAWSPHHGTIRKWATR